MTLRLRIASFALFATLAFTLTAQPADAAVATISDSGIVNLAIPPVLDHFSIEIDRLTRINPAVTAAFLTWHQADPARAVEFLTFLQTHPKQASHFYRWVAAHPAVAVRLFLTLAR